MESHGFRPERITKPIQLLAAWLVGLSVTNASFLLAAKQIGHPSWGAALLLIASVVNVPLFIVALFLLQTKFRPQMQEDPYYSKYLDEERKSTTVSPAERNIDEEIARTVERIVASVGGSAKGKEEPISEILHQSQVEALASKHGGTRSLSQLYAFPATWGKVAAKFADDPAFRKELYGLIDDGLVALVGGDPATAVLTTLGRAAASFAEKNRALYLQLHPERWKAKQTHLLNVA
jgi:hypothetical protein